MKDPVTVDATPLDGGSAQKSLFRRKDRPLTYGEVIDAWRNDDGFVRVFAAHLADSRFAAFQWETPPVTRAGFARAFEMVVTDSPGLARATPDRMAFADQFREAEGDNALVARFANLGGDAVLVAPVGGDGEACCTHMAAFCRGASHDRQCAFWREVGRAMDQQVRSTPVWLSTAGHGVHWLHARLDSRPKYYRHRPYKTLPVGP